jgi:hypothetical protein
MDILNNYQDRAKKAMLLTSLLGIGGAATVAGIGIPLAMKSYKQRKRLNDLLIKHLESKTQSSETDAIENINQAVSRLDNDLKQRGVLSPEDKLRLKEIIKHINIDNPKITEYQARIGKHTDPAFDLSKHTGHTYSIYEQDLNSNSRFSENG